MLTSLSILIKVESDVALALVINRTTVYRTHFYAFIQVPIKLEPIKTLTVSITVHVAVRKALGWWFILLFTDSIGFLESINALAFFSIEVFVVLVAWILNWNHRSILANPTACLMVVFVYSFETVLIYRVSRYKNRVGSLILVSSDCSL